MGKRTDMPSKTEIAEYWAERLIEMDIEDLPVDEFSCFVCGSGTKLQRSHILPMCDGGSNTTENLHLLCRQCHDESEFLSGEIYWRWYREKRDTAYISPAKREMIKVKAMFPDLAKVEEIYNRLEPSQREQYIKELIEERLSSSRRSESVNKEADSI